MTTGFDVYETLLHLLLEQIDVEKTDTKYFNLNNDRVNSLKGRSLFTQIKDRNCTEAHIPKSLCICGTFLNIKQSSPLIELAAVYMVNYINEVILKDSKDICVKYELKEIIDAQLTKDGERNRYLVIFKVSPNDAIFDGTVVEKDMNSPELNHKFNILDRIQRISSYGTTSKCINIYFLRSFCYCKIQNG